MVDLPGDADHERGRLGVLVQEGRCGLPSRSSARDVEVQQAAERQVHLRHLGEVERVAETAQTLDVFLIQRERQARCEGRPIAAIDLEERGEAAVRRTAVGGTGV